MCESFKPYVRMSVAKQNIYHTPTFVITGLCDTDGFL